MKEFVSAVEDIEAEEAREARIEELIAQGNSREDAETLVDRGTPVEFMIDGRVLKGYKPNEGQLIFLLASLGRGQSKESRMASIVNIMMESLGTDDKDYFEGRLLSSDPKNRLRPKVIEEVFEHLTAEWFRKDVPGDDPALPTAG